MHLTSVRIQNYRGLKDVEVDLDSETVLIGENNSGKTAFLEALKVCLQDLRSKRSRVFGIYDFHLPEADTEPSASSPIRLTLTFAEKEPGEWNTELIQELAGLAQVDEEERNSLTFRVEAALDATLEADEIQVDWFFLDLDGNHLTTQEARYPGSLGTLQNCSPVFYLSALRDAGSHFRDRGRFWRPFLRNDAIAPERRAEIEGAIREINQLIVESHGSFGDVRDRLGKVREVVATGAGNVSIDAVPPRIFDMLTRAQVSLSAPGGARIPIGRHGEGTQSLAVLLLFDAFLNSEMPAAAAGAVTEPILALEEPEAHLHPSAIRSIFRTVEALRGQKIVATHSGDLLSEVDVSKVRRFARVDDAIQVFSLREGTLDAEGLRKFNYHVRRFRGELLFARCWLLVEGETDVTLLSETARLLGHDLEAIGIRCVETRHVGVEILLKVARDFGIRWHLLADGDLQGRRDRKTALSYLGADEEAQRVTVLPARHVEEFLCKKGFGSIYSKNVSEQKRRSLEGRGEWKDEADPDHWDVIVRKALSLPKPAIVLQVIEEMAKKEKGSVPKLFQDVLGKASLLAQR